MKKRLFAGILAVASCLPPALPAAESEISIHDPYVRLAPPGIRTTAGFMLIRNAGAEDRRLLKAESPAESPAGGSGGRGDPAPRGGPGRGCDTFACPGRANMV